MRDRHDTIADRLASLAYGLLDSLEEAKPFLRDWPTEDALRPQDARPLPVLDHLAAARAAASPTTAPFVDALARDARALDWGQTYSASEVDPAFLDRYGWTEFVGLRGPRPSETLACGVLMLGPQADYPLHAHAAEELYLPIAGAALWRRGDEDFATRLPGTPIHHPSFMPHAMRTGAEPLLALYLWRGGDLAASSRLLPP